MQPKLTTLACIGLVVSEVGGVPLPKLPWATSDLPSCRSFYFGGGPSSDHSANAEAADRFQPACVGILPTAENEQMSDKIYRAPWQLGADQNGDLCVNDAASSDICTIGLLDDPDNGKAVADLIVAAPDLLSALEHLTAHVKNPDPTSDQGIALAAIAKARNGTTDPEKFYPFLAPVFSDAETDAKIIGHAHTSDQARAFYIAHFALGPTPGATVESAAKACLDRPGEGPVHGWVPHVRVRRKADIRLIRDE